VGAELSGIAPMFFITFKKDSQSTYKEKRKSFYTQLIRRGIFMQPYHHGYISYRHTEDELDKAVIAIEEAISCI
jgi:glutamate-1-semialdehyde aminotransferase